MTAVGEVKHGPLGEKRGNFLADMERKVGVKGFLLTGQ
jgi:hypothetical protein